MNLVTVEQILQDVEKNNISFVKYVKLKSGFKFALSDSLNCPNHDQMIKEDDKPISAAYFKLYKDRVEIEGNSTTLKLEPHKYDQRELEILFFGRKTVHYLSPSAISAFYENSKEYYLTYISKNRPPSIPQTRPMSIGSAFDAYCKSYLHEKLFGKGKDPKFELKAIFEAQVESQNRDWALAAGKYAFEKYHASGALGDIMLELSSAIGDPKFEFEIKGVIDGKKEGVTKEIGPVTLLGKPDLFFINKHGAHVILDWKVNGFCSKTGPSPMAGYVRLREPIGDSWQNAGAHKNAFIMQHNGVMINSAAFLEHFDKSWAQQLSIYAWLLGEDIGADFIVAVDQLVCKPFGEYPLIRIAEHRLRVSSAYQWEIFAAAQHVWEVVHSDHFFRDLSKEDSQIKCKQLDEMADVLKGDSIEDKWFANVSRK